VPHLMEDKPKQIRAKKPSAIEAANQIPKTIALWFGAIAAVGAALPFLSRYGLVLVPATLAACGLWIWRADAGSESITGKRVNSGSCLVMMVASGGMAVFLVIMAVMTEGEMQTQLWQALVRETRDIHGVSMEDLIDRKSFACYGAMTSVIAAMTWSGAFLKRLSLAIEDYVEERLSARATGSDGSTGAGTAS
jgi:hypothetical protein